MSSFYPGKVFGNTPEIFLICGKSSPLYFSGLNFDGQPVLLNDQHRCHAFFFFPFYLLFLWERVGHALDPFIYICNFFYPQDYQSFFFCVFNWI